MLLALVQVLGLSLGFHICHEFTLLKSLYAEFQIAFKVDVLICFVILFIWLIYFFFGSDLVCMVERFGNYGLCYVRLLRLFLGMSF